MAEVLAFVAVIAGIAAILGGLALLASRARSRRIGGAFMGPFDEIYNPAAHRARIEIHQQAEHAAPRPSPDDQ